MELEVNDEGLFHAGDALSLCWSLPWRHAFFLRVDGRLAGFVILDEGSRLTGAREVMDVSQFFVMRRYRRKGLARRARRARSVVRAQMGGAADGEERCRDGVLGGPSVTTPEDALKRRCG